MSSRQELSSLFSSGAHVAFSLPVSRTHRHSTSAVSAFALALVSALLCPHVCNRLIGKKNPLTAVQLVLTTIDRYLIWIGMHYTLSQRPDTNTPLKGSEQEKTFGPTISNLIHKNIGPERLLLWDSKARGGRPDTMKIVKEAYTYWNAEGNYPLIHKMLTL